MIDSAARERNPRVADNLSPDQRSYCMSPGQEPEHGTGTDHGPHTSERLAYASGSTTHVWREPLDIVFYRRKIAVFIDGGLLQRLSLSNLEGSTFPFWRSKIEKNRKRDAKNFAFLAAKWLASNPDLDKPSEERSASLRSQNTFRLRGL